MATIDTIPFRAICEECGCSGTVCAGCGCRLCAAAVNAADRHGSNWCRYSTGGCPRLVFFTLTQACGLTPESEVGAVCGKAARTDLCGGQGAISVPTATERSGQAEGSSGMKHRVKMLAARDLFASLATILIIVAAFGAPVVPGAGLVGYVGGPAAEYTAPTPRSSVSSTEPC